MQTDAVDWITERTLAAIVNGEWVPPSALTLLLRQYAVTGRADVGEALGPALAQAIAEAEPGGNPKDRSSAAVLSAEWLFLFTEAIGLSEDRRLLSAAVDLTERIRRSWPSEGSLEPAMRSLDACLRAVHLEEIGVDLPAAIDELERLIGRVYVPGHGVARNLVGGVREPGGLAEHAGTASALLSAFNVTGRLPYSMLAEELMQFARVEWWDAERGGFQPPTSERTTSEHDSFAARCEAVRVLCRLASLHLRSDYRQAAVIARHSDYSADAGRALEALSDDYRRFGLDAAVYGLALSDARALASQAATGFEADQSDLQ